MHLPLEPPHYRADVLRCCKEHRQYPEQPATWHFSLEEVCSGKRHGFTTLDALAAYLEAELSAGNEVVLREAGSAEAQ